MYSLLISVTRKENTMRNLKLKKKIEESGLKKTHIAMKAGINPSELSHMLSGRINATAEEKKDISNVLKCRVEDIF